MHFTIMIVKSLIVICPPNQIAVITGKNRTLSDGRTVGYRILKEHLTPEQYTVISFQHDNISFRTLLGMVAGLSAYSVRITSSEIVFTDISPPLPRTAIEQNSPHALSAEALEQILNNPEETRKDLVSLGLHSPEVFGFPDDPKNLANLIHSLQDARLDPENQERQVLVHNSLVSFPPGYQFEATDLSSADLQLLMREWSQTKGVDIMATPSITARPGQDATIEIGKEVIFPKDQENQEFQTEWVDRRPYPWLPCNRPAPEWPDRNRPRPDSPAPARKYRPRSDLA